MFFTFWYERFLFLVWIYCAKINEVAGTLRDKFIYFRHSGVESITANAGSRGGQGSSLPPTEKSTENMAVIAATDTSHGRTISRLQTISEGPTGDVKEVGEG